MTHSCFYHGRDNIDYIVTFSIAGRVFDYHLTTLAQVDACEYLARRWPLKGLNYAKRWAKYTTIREYA